jgi:hypothetical protein
MSALAFTEDLLDADARASYETFEHTLRCAAGREGSLKLTALIENAGRAYASALSKPSSEARWAAFVWAVSAYLNELEAGIGIAVDRSCGRSRRELRDIVYENDDLLESGSPFRNAVSGAL